MNATNEIQHRMYCACCTGRLVLPDDVHVEVVPQWGDWGLVLCERCSGRFHQAWVEVNRGQSASFDRFMSKCITMAKRLPSDAVTVVTPRFVGPS